MRYLPKASVAAAALAALAGVCGCATGTRTVQIPASRPTPPAIRPAPPISAAWTAKSHPRLMMDAAQIQSWQAHLSPQQQEMWQQVCRQIDRLKNAKPPTDGRFNRGHGNMMARLAVTARLTADPQLLAAAKAYLLAVCRMPDLPPAGDLERGHLMWGGAIAYDWLYRDLTEAQRTTVRAMLARTAEAHYQQTTAGRGYWRNQWLQNHGHVNLCGLAFAAAALYGEDPRAPRWLRLADDFFAETFRWSNPDGTSIEGLSYGMYAMEFCLRYAELARQLYGLDYFRTQWFANVPLYVLHSTLPVMTKDEWAMTFADSPRNANSHLPTHSMARIAAELDDPVAQGAGQLLRQLHGDLGNDPWQTVMWYDAKVPAAQRSQLPTFHEFADTGQVMMRTDWSADAMLVGLRCGPWLGQNAWGRARWDFGAAHEHPDCNSFQVFAEGTWLLIDPGYTYLKRTSDHSTMLVDGAGQLGGNVMWFAAEDASRYDHYARIARAETNEQFDYVMGDATCTYHPGLGLKRFVRHWLFLKPTRTLVIVDDVAAEPTGYYKAWTRRQMQFHGMKVESPRREFLVPDRPGRKGKVWFIYDGPCGTFDVDVDYFDNSPGEGRYALAVAGKDVARWADDVQDTDLHTRTVHNVRIHEGDKVELRGEPFSRTGKFIKIAVSGRKALRAQPHQVQMLLHAPPSAKVTPVDVRGEDAVQYAVDAGQAVLDVWATGPGIDSSFGEYEVLQGSRIKQTQRIVLAPELQEANGEQAAVVVTVLQPHKAGVDGLRRASADANAMDRSVSVQVWDSAGAWDAKVSLEDGQVRVERQVRPTGMRPGRGRRR
jgi:hypothetical protein